MKMISIDDLIKYCDNACTALRRVAEFAKEYAIEVETENIGWIDDDTMPNEDMRPDNEVI